MTARRPIFPRVCVSVGRGRPATVLDALEDLDFAEIRIDLVDLDLGVSGPWRRWSARLFAPGRLTIATCRPGVVREAERLDLLLAAIGHGARLVDVELSASAPFRRQIRAAIHERGGSLILSHHDLARTASAPELRRIAARGFERGADLVKIACAVNSGADGARLLSLLDVDEWRGRVVLAGLGRLGPLLRALAIARGSPFTYAAPDNGAKVIGDQPRVDALRRAIEALARLGRSSPSGAAAPQVAQGN